MKTGFWGNYETGVIFEIDEHELWIRRGNNASCLGIPDKVVSRFKSFKAGKDRDRFLRFLFASAPVMRIRGHGESVTFEFSSGNRELPLMLIRRWGEDNAGPCLRLKIVNFKTGEARECLWKDFKPE